jgi:hypothetical protein
VFHLTPSGQAVLGEPPVPKDAPKERATRERIEFDAEGALQGLGEKLSKIKLPDAKMIGIIAVVLLAVAGAGWLLSRQSLEQRSELLTAAIRKGDVEVVMGVALPGTEGDALKWYADIYKEYLDLKLSMGGQDPAAKVQVQQATGGNSAQTLLSFSRGGGTRVGRYEEDELQPAPATRPTKHSLDLVIFWTPDTWGNWRFDAKRTAEVGSANPK